MGNIACVVIVKNAEAIIAEWLSYHLALGFETILIFDNDSTDSTLHVVNKFQRKHDIRVIPWPIETNNYQTEAYEYGLFKFGREFTWLAFIDSDEFLTFPPGKTLKTLLDVPEGIAAIALPWAFFGSNGHVSRPKNLVIKSYLHRSESDFFDNKSIKSIVRPDRVIRVSGPHNCKVRGAYVDMNHERIKRPSWKLEKSPDYAGGKLNHYFVQSREDWAKKIARGYHDTQRSLSDFQIYDRNEIYDDDALRLLPQVEAILENAGSVHEDSFLKTLPTPSLLGRRIVQSFWCFNSMLFWVYSCRSLVRVFGRPVLNRIIYWIKSDG